MFDAAKHHSIADYAQKVGEVPSAEEELKSTPF